MHHPRHHRSHTPRARLALAATLTALAALATASLTAPALAANGDYTQILCANPDTGQGLGVDRVDGLTTPASAAAWQASTTGACATEPKTAANAITLGPSSAAHVPYDRYAAIHYRLADPALTLASARYWRAFTSTENPFEVSTRIIQHGGENVAEPSDPTNGFDSFWTGKSQAAGIAGQPFSADNAVSAQHNERSFTVTAQCRDVGGGCAHPAGDWSYLLFGGKARLHDAEPPTVEAVGGSVLDGGPLTTESLSFRVSDRGAGIYRLKITIDGDELVLRDLTPGADLTADDRRATCFDVNPHNQDDYEFAHQQPCPASLEWTETFTTHGVLDGPHTLRAVAEDAGGNETVLVERNVVVDNHPAPTLTSEALPAISGTPAVGGALTGANAAWRDATSYDYLWDRCPTPATCVTLADHPGRTYALTPDDVGAQMRFVVVATNDAGEWTVARSPLSAPVTRAAAPDSGTDTPRLHDATPDAAPDSGRGDTPPAHGAAAPAARGQNGRGATRDARLALAAPGGRAKLRTRITARTQLSGRLTDAAGRPIAGASLELTARNTSAGAAAAPLGTVQTRDDGSFDYVVPPGPSRHVEVAYRATLSDDRPAATASVRLVVPAAVSLRIRPARPGRTTWLTGALRHLPRAGIQLQVQALDGRRWRTFDTTTTTRGGRFRFGYRFKPPAAGRTFHLRVLVASPIYPFAAGASRAIRIHVPE